tara:strand:+ start:448 stop:621 length:174 start_codon:yes stop_codon:yes gene_type:complete
MDNLVYRKKKLYQLSDYMNALEVSAISMFNTEQQRHEAVKRICEVNNILEGILKDEE